MKGFDAIKAAAPRGKGAIPLFIAFLLFHVEHFNVFNNREVMRLSLGSALTDGLMPDLLPVAVTSASFLVFGLLYRWNKLYLKERKGLAISCCLIALVPMLWFARGASDGGASLTLGCMAMGLFAFGHLLFYFGYDLFYAALWPLYSYLVRYSTFNYYWLPVIGAFGSYLGRALGLVCARVFDAEVFPGLSEFRWLAVSILLFGSMLLAIAFYGRNNMRSGWGSVVLRANAVSDDARSSSCETLAAMAGMTAREKSVFTLLAKGYTSKLIAEKLHIAPGTAKTHIKHVYSKLGLHSQQELIAMVEQNEHHANLAAPRF